MVKTSINARTVTMKVDDIGDWDSSGSAIKIETTKVLSTWYVSAICSTKTDKEIRQSYHT